MSALPLNKPTPDRVIETPEWQMQDIDYLASKPYSANWSEMGCYKTSTALWLAMRKVQGIENPSILFITTAGGKGTYFDMVPEILPNYTLFNVGTQGISIVLPGGKQVKVQKELPDRIDVPHIILTHYQVFARWNHNKLDPCIDCEVTGIQKVPGMDLEIICPTCNGAMFVKKPLLMADYLNKHEWDFVGVDEAHRLKGRETKWTVGIKRLKAKHKHIMTGTGFINRPDEIWSLLDFLAKGQDMNFGSYNRFVEYFCEIDDWSGYRKVVGVKEDKKDEFRTLVREYGVRRTLDEVMPHIKKAIKVRKDVELSTVQKRMYNEIKTELKALDKKGEPFHSPNVLSALQRLRQICVATPEVVKDEYDEKLEKRVMKIKLVEPSSKLDELMELIDGMEWDDDNRQQLVVFSNFRDPLELLKVRLEKANIPYIHMDTSDDEETRYKKWHDEFPKKEHQIFMSTLQLGGESINLTSAQHVCFLDRSWSPKDNNQGIGRVRRPGQSGEPVVINIEAKGTTDQKLERVNAEKEGWFNEIFGDEDEI